MVCEFVEKGMLVSIESLSPPGKRSLEKMGSPRLLQVGILVPTALVYWQEAGEVFNSLDEELAGNW